MSSAPLSQEKSFLLILKKLWRRDGERVDLDICDLAVVEADQRVSRWLFTSKEGTVRSKRSENCSARRLVEHAQRVEELLCGDRERERERESRSLALRGWFAPCAVSAETERESERESGRVCERETEGGPGPALRWQALSPSLTLSLPQGRSFVVVPSAQTAGETRLLKATFQRDARNLYALPKVKCFLPSLAPLPQRDRERDRDRDRDRDRERVQWPQSFVECRNAFTASIVQAFVAKLVKLIDSQSSSAVLSLTLFVLLCEEERDAHLPLQSPDRFRVWLHHVESLQFAAKETSTAPSSSVSASASSLVRRLDSSSELLSQASVLKPWALCDGDFCFFSRSAADENGEFDSVLDEARRAIRRHRSLEEDELSGAETAINNENDNDGDHENDDFAGSVSETQRETERASSTQPTKLPMKALRITNKWILRAREEMEELARLDQRLAELSHSHSGRQRDRDSEEASAVRERIAELWPASVSRWWLSDSERQRVRPRLREKEREAEREKERYRQAIEREGVAENESEGGKKWFSVNYSQSTVCENCFFVYELLEKHRKARERREIRISKEAKETDAQRRKREQDIERRMFEQRRLATRLSKCKSAPAVVQNDPGYSASLAQKLPPLPWKATTRYNTQREDGLDALTSKRSVAQHLMQRPVLLPIERVGVAEDSTAREWAALVARQEEREKARAQLPPLRRPKEVEKPTVDVTNYTAQHLLHPWQRELQKLREQAMNDNEGKAVLSQDISSQSNKQQAGGKARSPAKLASIVQIGATGSAEEDEEDGEFGELGWSPFVI